MLGMEYVAILEEQQKGFDWDNIGVAINEDEVTMTHILVFLLVDTVLFIGFTLYFDSIVPSPFGTHKKWHFICTDCLRKRDKFQFQDDLDSVC